MNTPQEPLETLREIRSMMERSSRFLSLSGLSGAIAGLIAIIGVAATYQYFGLAWNEPGYYQKAIGTDGNPDASFYYWMIGVAATMLIVALAFGIILSARKAKKQGQPLWDSTAQRLMLNLSIPLVAGGLYSLILLYHGSIALIPSAMLIFYGLALINASKYTLNDIRSLGTAEIITGLAAALFIDFGLLFWAFGFGALHVVYGLTMYFKYDK